MTLSGGLKATHTNSQELGAAWKKTPKGRTVTQETKVRTKQPLFSISQECESNTSLALNCVSFITVLL